MAKIKPYCRHDIPVDSPFNTPIERISSSGATKTDARLAVAQPHHFLSSGSGPRAVSRPAYPEELRGRVEEIAMLVHTRWSKKDGDPRPEFYHRQLTERFSNAVTPAFVVEHEGAIEGIIFPIRVFSLFSTWNELTGNGLWTTDRADGSILICPQIVVAEKPAVSHVARALIVGGVLTYARSEARAPVPVEKLEAFSRPAQFGTWAEQFQKEGHSLSIGQYLTMTLPAQSSLPPTVKKLLESARLFADYIRRLRPQPHISFDAFNDFLKEKERVPVDANMRMHTSFGGRISQILPKACPLDAQAGGFGVRIRYDHLLQ